MRQRRIPLKLRLSILAAIIVILPAIGISALYIRGQLGHIKEHEEEYLAKAFDEVVVLAQMAQPYVIENNYVGMHKVVGHFRKRPYVNYVLLTDDQNKILMHTDSRQIGTLFKPAEAIKTIEAKEGRLETYYSPEGKEFIEAAYPIKAGDLLLGQARINLATEWVKREIAGIRKTIFIFILVALGAILAGVLITLSVLNKVANNILYLRSGMKKIGEGDYSSRFEVKRNDEIGDLALSLNKMAEDLRASQENLVLAKDYTENIISSILNSLMVVSPQAKIRSVNKATCDLLGYNEKELVDKHIGMIFAEEVPFTFKRSGIEYLIKMGSIRNIEKTLLSKDNRRIPVLFSGLVMRDKDNNIQVVVCVAQDISELKKGKEELEAAKKELEQTVSNLERLNKVMFGREERILELKKKLKESGAG